MRSTSPPRIEPTWASPIPPQSSESSSIRRPPTDFTDLFHDGSLALAYRATRSSLGATETNVLRWKRFKIERVGVFSEGRFIRLEGGAVVVAHELPLGRYLSMGCEDFGTISSTAFKTTLNAPRTGGFMDAS